MGSQPPDLISNLPDHFKVAGNWYNKSAPDGWIRFVGHEGEFGSTGWKLHVSATTPAAQEALAKLALKHGVHEFKFAETLGEFLNPASPQSGKTAVFFHSKKGVDGKPIDWAAFIAQAEEIVHKHGGPGPAVQRDKQVPGAKAIYYRNDRGAQGEAYIPRRGITVYGRDHGIVEERLHNLANVDDPFAHISLETSPESIPAEKTVAARSKPNPSGVTAGNVEHHSAMPQTVEQSEASGRSLSMPPAERKNWGSRQSLETLPERQASWARRQWLAFKSAPTSVKVGVIAGGAAAAAATGWLVNPHRHKDVKEKFTDRLDKERSAFPAASR